MVAVSYRVVCSQLLSCGVFSGPHVLLGFAKGRKYILETQRCKFVASLLRILDSRRILSCKTHHRRSCVQPFIEYWPFDVEHSQTENDYVAWPNEVFSIFLCSATWSISK